jgi:HAMP domain-containing protein
MKKIVATVLFLALVWCNQAFAIDNLWVRINHLVPNPQCTTKGNQITSWSDPRAQPTNEELAALDIDVVLAEHKANKMPPVAAQIEAIWEQLEETGLTNQKANEMRQQINRAKNK